MPVRSNTLISVAFFDSAARTASSQLGIVASSCRFSVRSTLDRVHSCPYRTTGRGSRVWSKTQAAPEHVHGIEQQLGIQGALDVRGLAEAVLLARKQEVPG